MLKIRSTDKEAQALVSKLVTLLTDAGAFFHPSLQLDIRGAEMSISSRKKLKANDRLIQLPLRCMPLLDDFRWFLDDSQSLCWAPADAPAAEDYEFHMKVVELLVQLYNRFGKVAAFALSSPAVQFADKRPLVERLLALAHAHPLRARLDGEIDQLMISAFWNARVFSDYLSGRLHLIPVMEFFDHSLFSDGFLWGHMDDGHRVLSHSYYPIEGSKGLFARYKIMDNLHAFAEYGFVDEQVFFVQSQPFSLEISQTISLEVGYQSVSANRCEIEEWHTPPRYSNSLMYRAKLKFLPDRIFMPFLLVPPPQHLPAFDEALMVQLQEVERHLGESRGQLANPAILLEIKQAMLDENESAYRSLARMAREAELDVGVPAVRLLKKMLAHQRQILNEFRLALR